MAGFNGTISAGIQPFDNFSSNLGTMSYNWRANYLKSAHTQMRYQVMWDGLNENQEPLASNFSSGDGDIINIIFRVYASTQFPYPTTSADWDLVGTIRKTRDIANRSYINGQANLNGQRFTIDISQLCQDLLSYSLVPINKGTWQNSEWGGMNGGETKQDNVTQGISFYNVTPNGTYRHIWVTATPEILLLNGTVEEATGSGVSISFNKIAVINSVAQFEKDAIYYNLKYIIQKFAANPSNPRGFMSLCPNFTQTTNAPFLKQVREDEEAEWLYWWQRNMGNLGDQTTKSRLKVETYLSNGSTQNTMYLTDFNSNLDTEVVSGPTTVFKLNQNRICVQNVSPTYINANAVDNSGSTITNQIDSSTSYYKIHLEYTSQTSAVIRATEFRYFGIDRETANIPFGFVRFHWLNRIGGVDSYTAKRDVMEGLSVSRDTIETKSADRTWYQDKQTNQPSAGTNLADDAYVSNTMRGGNLYKGGREVLNVKAQKNNSVFTEPLNKQTAEWLEEIMTSPNVWIEMDTEATARGNTVNPYQRPSTKGYIPVIITNSEVETLNQEAGLVKFNIEYTLAHKVQTQRN
jgi:hypothetical protein